MSTVTSVKVKKNDGKIVELPLGVEATNIAWNGSVGLKAAIGTSPFKVYENVQEMQDDAFNLSLGKCVRTLGYYQRGDGGGADYIIDITTAPFSIYISSTFRANMIIPANGVVSALQFGIKKDGSGYPFLVKDFLQHNKYVHALYFPRGTYTFPNENFEINGNINIYGDGEETIFQSQRQYKVIFNGNAKIEDIKLMGGLTFMSKDENKFRFKTNIYN